MASSATFSQSTFSYIYSFSHTSKKIPLRLLPIKAVQSTEPENEKLAQKKTQESSNAQPSITPSKLPKKPVYSMKKGQIVRVDKENILIASTICQLVIHHITKAWTTYMKTVVRYLIYVTLRPGSML
ncbi:unnamed protein product [Ilex paraguariensis]|uniref:Uncharacterized protein n=1 Tax=Ilex paraguariensis TaxID=185542 RepID=A0ABC8RV91_9AQUA